MFIDGKPFPPMMATIRTVDDQKTVIDREYYRQLGAAGIRIFFLICDTVWLKPEALNLFDEEARALLEVVPDAYIVPRIGLHPTNDWIEKHPEETVTYSDGSRLPVHLFTESYVSDLPAHYSLCSEVWRQDAGAALEETWNKLMSLPYADRIIGCFLAAGGTSEWYYMLPMVRANGLTAGHSESFKRNFSWYLREKYGDDETLRRSWRREDVSIDNPPIPSAQAHFFAKEADKLAAVPPCRITTNSDVPPPFGNGTNIGSFADVDKHMDVYDFYRALHNGVAQSVLHFAKIIKRLTPDRVVGAFYGAYGCTDYFSFGTSGGVMRILNDENVDFLAAPGVYQNREAGGFVGQREMSDSFALHNKMFVVEEDTRTHMENRYFADKYRVYDLTDSLNVMKRDFGRTLCEDVHAWWFDQILAGRRFKCDAIYDLIRQQQQIAQQAYASDRRKVSEIAFIYDEESLQTVSQQTSAELVEVPRNYEKDRIGAPVDMYFHNDMSNAAMPSYKLYVFCNTLVLTEEEREQIRLKLKKDRAVALFLYGAGVIDPEAQTRFSTQHMTELCGIRMGRIDDRYDSKFRLDGETHRLTEGLDRRKLFGVCDRVRRNCLGQSIEEYWESYLYPLFYVDDAQATVVAHFASSGLPAMAVKEEDGFTSVFCGAKYVSSELLRSVAAFAGCHIYCDTDDVVYANRQYVVFHASSTGKKTLRFPREVSPYEVYEEHSYGDQVTEITFEAYLGETKMFLLK